MKTLKDVKARLAPGVEVDVINHVRPQASGTRAVHKNQTKSIAWKLPDGTITWLKWPKASELRFEGSNRVTFMHDDPKSPGTLIKFVTITFKETL